MILRLNALVLPELPIGDSEIQYIILFTQFFASGETRTITMLMIELYTTFTDCHHQESSQDLLRGSLNRPFKCLSTLTKLFPRYNLTDPFRHFQG